TLGLADPALLGAGADARLLRMPGWMSEMMGMALYNPPSVAGWPGGHDWINPSTFFLRANMVSQLLQLDLPGRPAVDTGALVNDATTPEAIVDSLLAAFLGPGAVPALRQALLIYLGGRTDDL